MPRTYYHLFTGDRCEAPGCSIRTWSLYPTNQGRNLIRVCCPGHVTAAEAALRHNDNCASVESARP